LITNSGGELLNAVEELLQQLLLRIAHSKSNRPKWFKIKLHLRRRNFLTNHSLIVGYLLKLSKKFNLCIFMKFAYNNINHLKIY